MGGSGVLAALVLARGRSSRLGGAVLLVAYAGLCVSFYVAGDR
jgi:Ca2+/H+ antiporter